MTKISVELGLTLKLASGGGFNMFKPSLSIQDIDLDAEVTPQIESALAAIHQAYGSLEGAMADVIQNSEVEAKGDVITEMGKHITEVETRLRTLELAANRDDAEKEAASGAIKITDGKTASIVSKQVDDTW